MDAVRQQGLPQELLPGILFGTLVPAVVGAFVGYLRDEVEGGSIVETAADLQSGGPFLSPRTGTVEVEEEGQAFGRSGASGCFLPTPVEVQYGVRFQLFGQVPVAGRLFGERSKGGQLLFFTGFVGLFPQLPDGFASGIHVFQLQADGGVERLLVSRQAGSEEGGDAGPAFLVQKLVLLRSCGLCSQAAGHSGQQRVCAESALHVFDIICFSLKSSQVIKFFWNLQTGSLKRCVPALASCVFLPL